MAKSNLSGEAPQGQYPKVLIGENAYTAKLVNIEPDVVEMGNEKFGKKPKMILKWDIDGEELPQFVSPVVTRGSGSFQDSACFVLISKADLIEKFAQTLPTNGEFPDADLIEFIRDNIVGKLATVVVKNTKSDNPYSLVKEVVTFTKPTVQKKVGGV